MVLFENIKNTMELSFDFVQVIQDLVLKPDFGSAIAIFFLSFVNELVPFLPYGVVLSSQLLFLKGSLTVALLTKLFVLVAVPVGVGSAIGTLPVYVVAYFGGKPAIDKFHKFLRFSWQDVEKVTSRFKGAWYDEVLFFMLRFIPFLPTIPVSVAAGILRMHFWPYFILTILGLTIRMMLTLIMVGLGVGTLAQ